LARRCDTASHGHARLARSLACPLLYVLCSASRRRDRWLGSLRVAAAGRLALMVGPGEREHVWVRNGA
jgi:hypothetical protein